MHAKEKKETGQSVSRCFVCQHSSRSREPLPPLRLRRDEPLSTKAPAVFAKVQSAWKENLSSIHRMACLVLPLRIDPGPLRGESRRGRTWRSIAAALYLSRTRPYATRMDGHISPNYFAKTGATKLQSGEEQRREEKACGDRWKSLSKGAEARTRLTLPQNRLVPCDKRFFEPIQIAGTFCHLDSCLYPQRGNVCFVLYQQPKYRERH